jgi:hypothetical protein
MTAAYAGDKETELPFRRGRGPGDLCVGHPGEVVSTTLNCEERPVRVAARGVVVVVGIAPR